MRTTSRTLACEPKDARVAERGRAKDVLREAGRLHQAIVVVVVVGPVVRPVASARAPQQLARDLGRWRARPNKRDRHVVCVCPMASFPRLALGKGPPTCGAYHGRESERTASSRRGGEWPLFLVV